MKKLVLLLFIALLSFTGHAQYRKYKNQYDVKEYKYQKTDPYNPTGIAVVSILVPGLGHVAIGEPLRGLGFYALTYGSLGLAVLGMDQMNENSNQKLGNILAISGATLWLGSYIWSIVDVKRVARIKNMAFRDKNVAIHLHPSLQNYASKNALGTSIGGATLRINF